MFPRIVDNDALHDPDAIVKWLRQPGTYAERPAHVDCVETHISWVFLTDRFAYKLKKPVRFDFVDFSTTLLRRVACEDEIRLNRRLAPNVYLDVLPITSDAGQLNFGGKGSTVDWVVKMRRLPADRSLDGLIRSGNLIEVDVHQIGSLLSEFYQHVPPLSLRTDDYRHEIEEHVRGNRHELIDARHGLDQNVIKRTCELQLRLLQLQPDLLDNRVRDGRIVEGHGDLRPEHIYMASLPIVIDCIEFDTRLRRLDVLDELSFLWMECAALGADWVGDQIIGHYLEDSGDEPPTELLYFYKSYRACVRAKVHALRAAQLAVHVRQAALADAESYLRLADGYSRQLGPPLLFVVRGLTGTGKSTLAAALAEKLEIDYLQSDAVRRELFGKSPRPADYDSSIYQPSHRARVYARMFHRADALLCEGLSVILDGTFLRADMRSQAVALAAKHGAAPLIIRCECPDELAMQRIAARTESVSSASESRPDIFLRQTKEDEPDPPGMPSLGVNTDQGVPGMVEAVFAKLRQPGIIHAIAPQAGHHT